MEKRYVWISFGKDSLFSKVKTAFGTNFQFDQGLEEIQGKFLAQMKKWYKPYEALKLVATHDNAQLPKLCGPRGSFPGEVASSRKGRLPT